MSNEFTDQDFAGVTQEEIDHMTKMQLEEWRDEYGAVYLTDINDINFVWRGLSRAEFRKVSEYYEDDFEKAEFVCRLCVLDPIIEDYSDEIYAGVPEVLAQNILRESGFTEDASKIESLIAMYEQEMKTFEHQVSCIIKEAFPDISLEEIDMWPLEKTLWHYARAKWVLENLRGVVLERDDGV